MKEEKHRYDPLYNINDKVVVITGGCGLIGQEVIRQFAERGAKLVIVDIDLANPGGLAEATGRGAVGKVLDVSKADQVAQLCDFVSDRFGRVDVLINNHQYKPQGFLEAQPETFPEELWDAVLDVNLKGTFLTCRDFGARMLAQGKGSIINLASTYGVVSSNPSLYTDNSLGNPLAYTASKGGVVMLTKYLGAYWGARGVRVNAVTPHGVWNHHEQEFIDRFSRMSPMKRMSKAEEVVGAILYLASDASSYVTGSNLFVEGGWTAW